VFRFLRRNREPKLTADEIVSIVAHNLINAAEPPVAMEAFEQKEKYRWYMFRMRIFLAIIGAQHMKSKSGPQWQAVIDKLIERGTKAYSSEPEWSIGVFESVKQFGDTLLDARKDREFEKSLWAAFGYKNADGSATSPDVLIKLVLPTLREQCTAILDFFESAKFRG